MIKDRVVARWMATEQIAAADWPRLEALLEPGEQQRAQRFHFERDRQSYIAAHALGRAMLSYYAGGDPAGWRFAIGAHGKPEPIVPAGNPRLRLNLSHTHGLAAAVLTDTHDVGIDVERFDRRAAFADLAARYFSPREQALLAATPSESQPEIFLSLWSMKEAYVKAIGKGLAHSLDRFSVTLSPLALMFDDASAADPSQWFLHLSKPTPHHVLAIAVHHPNPKIISLDLAAATASDLCRRA